MYLLSDYYAGSHSLLTWSGIFILKKGKLLNAILFLTWSGIFVLKNGKLLNAILFNL